MKIRFFLFIVFYSLALSAQEKGQVIDKTTRKALGYCNIYLNDSTGLGITNENGEFSTDILSKVAVNDTVNFSYMGYVTERRLLKELKRDKYIVSMTEDAQHLREVTVLGRQNIRRLPYKSLCHLPDRLFSCGALIHNGKIYVIGGDATEVQVYSQGLLYVLERHNPKMYIYDIAQDTWSTDKHDFRKRSNHAIHLFDNRFYVLGGKRLSTNTRIEYSDETVEVYDMDRDTILVDPVNPHQALDFASFVYEDYLIVMGGLVRKHVYTDKIHAFNFKTGLWYEVGKMPQAKAVKGALVGHKIYLFGGSNGYPMWNIQSYDLQTGKWEELGELIQAVSCPGVTSNGEYIYIYENKTLQVYNIQSQELTAYTIGLDLNNSELLYYDNHLYIVGGCVRNGIYISPGNGLFSIDCRIFQ